MAGQVISRLTSSGGDDAGVHVISSSFYGTCSSAANSENKEVIISNHNIDEIKLVKGMLLTVKFINENTATKLPTLTLFENNAANDIDTPIKGEPLTIAWNIYTKEENTILPLKPKWSAGNIITFIYDEKDEIGRWIKISSSNEELIERVEEIEITTQGVIKEVDVEYSSSQSNIEAPTTGWQTSAPTYSPGSYIWQRTKTVTVGSLTPSYSDPICISNREINYSSYQYNLVCSPSVIIRDTTTSPSTLIPSAVTFSSTRAKENETPVEYISHFRVAESSDGTNWTSSFTPVDQSNIIYSIANSDSANLVKCTIYDIETQNQIDTQTIPIINSNAESENVYTAFLTDESHTFATAYSAAIDASISSQFVVYKGSTQVTATITNIDFIPYEGLTVTYSDNTFTVSVNSNLTTSVAQSGTLYITATTSDNNSFEKTFNWSLASMKEEGKAGVNGFNSTTVLLYQRYFVQPSNKPQNISYNFDTHRAIIPQESLWSDSIPSGTDPCWVSAATAIIEATVSPAIDNIADTEWSDPILLVQDGKDGLSQAKITLYKRALTKPSDAEKPGNLTYTFANGSLTPSENFNGWSLNIPEIGNNTPSPCWITTGVAISAAASDVIDSWAEPVQYIEKNIYSITEYYARNNSSTIAPTNNWSTPPIPTPTQDAKYIWNYELITYTDGTTNATSTGSTVHIAATYGADGKGITGITNYYARTNTPNAPTKGTTSPWSTTPQTVNANNKYLWNYEIVNYTTGDPSETNVHLIGAYGDAGIYPTSIIEEYIKTTSSTDEPEESASGWDVNPPVWESGKYIWTRSKIIWSDDNSPNNPHIDYTTPVLANSYNSIGEIAAAANETANSASEDARNAVESASQAFATASTAVQYAEVANLAASAAVACANTAYNASVSAQASADQAASAAATARASANAAISAAASAVESASVAFDASVSASNAAASAVESANIAYTAAQSASVAAASAVACANSAYDAAVSAATSANAAAQSAATAKTAADSALTQVSIIENVAGTLDWISKHGSYTKTTDTTVQEGTIYFKKENNDYIPIINPEGNPSEQELYILDITDSQSNYIMAHLAVTSAGLWILPSAVEEYNTTTDTTPQSGTVYYTRSGSVGNYTYTIVPTPTGNPKTQGWYIRATDKATGYKTLLSDSGMSIYDNNGNIVATYGNTIEFNSDRDWSIGTPTAFIYYDASENTLQIGGAGVTIGGKIPSRLQTNLYGTCSTSAATAKKQVTCLDASELFAGLTITVKFSTANTSTSPTLQVGSLDEKPIWVDNAVTSDSNYLFWNTNATITFTYNGSAWIVTDQPTTYYASCSTTAVTVKKAATCAASVVRKGTTVTVHFTNAHTSSTAATLYITGYSGTARTIYINGSTVTSTNNNSWIAGEVVAFVFDGQYWYASRGERGEDAISIWVGSDSQTVACGTDRKTTSTSTVTIPFTAYKGNTRIAATISYSSLPSGITQSSNTAGTTSANGSLVLNIASGASLGGTATTYDNVSITLTITANSKTFTKLFTFSKSIMGTPGSQGETGPQGPTGPESIVNISVIAINWTNKTATLQATLRINGEIRTNGVQYNWTKNTETASLSTTSTLVLAPTSSNQDPLNATYNCTCEWT